MTCSQAAQIAQDRGLASIQGAARGALDVLLSTADALSDAELQQGMADVQRWAGAPDAAAATTAPSRRHVSLVCAVLLWGHNP